MKISVKKNTGKTKALHFGEITGAESGTIYTFGIFNWGECDREILVERKARKCLMKDGTYATMKPKPYMRPVDSTGLHVDRACEWWIKFDQPALPDFFCRSDHKTAKRMALAIVAAYEAGLNG